MTKARDLADLIAAGNPLADGAISVAEISDLTASAAELNQLDNTADLPDIRPSLLLDFANSKTLDPRITFTRGSTAAYWDGKTTAKAEENLRAYSQELDNSDWLKSRADVTANNTTAPDGTTTAEKVAQASGETNPLVIYQNDVNTTEGDRITCSVFAKAGTNRDFILLDETALDGTFNNTWFNLSTGAVGTTNVGHTATITDAGNGWYRCSITFTATATVTDKRFGIRAAEADNLVTVTDNQGFVYLWGSQVEQRDTLTAYTATTSSPIVKYQPVLQTAASGEARFDHNPVTGESKGLLIEEARTNLFPYDNPSASAWYKNESTVTANATTAPDGTTTASKLVENATTNVHYTSETITVSGDTNYTLSVFAKAGERGYLKLQCGFVSNWVLAHDVIFDLSDGSLHNSSSGGSVEGTHFGSYDMGNGWYRLWISGTTTSSATAAGFNLHLATGVGSEINYTGNGYSGVFLWGTQMEQGSFPTSYIPTSGSTVTRAKDDAKITGNNFTDWYANTPISIYVDYSISFSQPNSRLLSLDDSSFNNRLLIGLATSSKYGPFLENFVDNVLNVFQGVSAITPTPTGSHKIAAALDFNDAAVTRDGGTLGTDSSCWVSPNIDQLVIGAQSSGANTMSGTIKKLAVYPKRLPNATLQAMTEV